MPPLGFEPTIPASARPQTYALDRAATGIGFNNIHRTIILPVVLYGCESWSLILWEEHKLRVFENMVLRKICGHKRDEVTGEWRGLHNEEFYDLYSSTSITRVIK
jgi:hypothetical protein